MNEAEFWNSTLRKINGLIDVYNKVNCPKANKEPEILTGSDAINSLMGLMGSL